MNDDTLSGGASTNDWLGGDAQVSLVISEMAEISQDGTTSPSEANGPSDPNQLDLEPPDDSETE